MRIRMGGLCAVLLVAAALPAVADVIVFDNGTPDLYGGQFCDVDADYQMAGDFVLSPGSNVITGVNWWGVYAFRNTAGDDSFSLYFYSSSGGIVNPAPFLEIPVGNPHRTDTGSIIWGYAEVYSYSADFAPVTLAAGDTYFVSIVNNTAGDTDDNWCWTTSGVFVGQLVPGREGINQGNLWDIASYVPAELSFQLKGPGGAVVPEPASAALLGLGLTGFAVRRVRKR